MLSKKLLSIGKILIIMFSIILLYRNILIDARAISFREKTIKIAVFLYDFNDTYISLVHKNLEEIQNNNKGKVEFNFYDGKDNQSIQNISIDKVLEGGDTDIIFLNLVDTKMTQSVIDKIKQKNIPVILFNREPIDINAVKSYDKAYFVGTDSKEAGRLQGKILINEWNSNKNIDKNGDGIMNYVMLVGEKDNYEAIDRTKYSVSSINEAGIPTHEIALKIADWNKDAARNIIDSLFATNGNKIEVVIANNDEMAIGAIEALQKYGYDKGDKSMNIPVVGIDAIPDARRLVDEGIMAGTIIQDPHIMAETIYDMGMNLAYGRKPLDGIQYTFDDTGVAVRLPYKEYISESNHKVI